VAKLLQSLPSYSHGHLSFVFVCLHAFTPHYPCVLVSMPTFSTSHKDANCIELAIIFQYNFILTNYFCNLFVSK
jgi:hypothetical protein